MLELFQLAQGEIILLGNRKFRKQIIKFGDFRHPNPDLFHDEEAHLEFDSEKADQIIKNFNDGVVETVQFLSSHDEETAHKDGVVLELIKVSDGIDAIIELSDEDRIAEVTTKMSDGRSLAGSVSAGLSLKFPLPESLNGPKFAEGPVLRHVAIAPIPWLNGMRDWEALEDVGEFSHFDFGHENYTGIPLLSVEEYEEENMNVDAVVKFLASQQNKTEDEVRAGLIDAGIIAKPEDKKSGGIELDADQFAAVLNFLKNTTSDDKDDDDKDKDKDKGVVGEAERIAAAVTEQVAPMTAAFKEMAAAMSGVNTDHKTFLSEQKDLKAATAVDMLIRDGKATPSQRDHYLKLHVSDEDLYGELTKDLEVRVDFSEEDEGALSHLDNPYTKGTGITLSNDERTSEVDRYSKVLASQASGGGRSDEIVRKGDN